MLSRQFRTIFVHIPKTGGQSVETVFIEAHGLKWKTRAPLLLRLNEDPAQGPRRLSHLYAREYVSLGHIGQDEFDDFFKFAVVRDPYDRLVSQFNYRDHACETVEELVKRAPANALSNFHRHVAPQVDYLMDEGRDRWLVDQIVRHESMEAEMAEIIRTVFGEDRPLPRRNVSSTKRLTTSTLSAGDVRFINAHYAEDFERLGYERRPS